MTRQAFKELNNAKSELSVKSSLNKTVGQVNDKVVESTIGVSAGFVNEGTKRIREDLEKTNQ